MTNFQNPQTSTLTLIFGFCVGLTLFIWLFRGFGLLTFIPGGVLWVLLLLSILSAIIMRVKR